MFQVRMRKIARLVRWGLRLPTYSGFVTQALVAAASSFRTSHQTANSSHGSEPPTLQRWAQGLRVHLCPVTPWINASGNVKGPVSLAPGKCLLWSLPVNSGVRHAAVEGCTSQPVTRPFLTETLQIVMIIALILYRAGSKLSKTVFLCPNKGQGSSYDKSGPVSGQVQLTESSDLRSCA